MAGASRFPPKPIPTGPGRPLLPGEYYQEGGWNPTRGYRSGEIKRLPTQQPSAVSPWSTPAPVRPPSMPPTTFMPEPGRAPNDITPGMTERERMAAEREAELETLREQARLDQEGKAADQARAEAAWRARMAAVPGLMDSFDPDASTMSVPGRTLDGGDNQAERAAEAAAFARAKDRIQQNTQANLRGLRENMTARGISGSGIEAAGTADILGGGSGDVNDVIREQAIEGLRRSQQVSDRNYQGNLTRRGQDISREEARRRMILDLINSGGRVY